MLEPLKKNREVEPFNSPRTIITGSLLSHGKNMIVL